jgi:hypothetical protein
MFYPKAIAIAIALSTTFIPFEIIGPTTFNEPVISVLPVCVILPITDNESNPALPVNDPVNDPVL